MKGWGVVRHRSGFADEVILLRSTRKQARDQSRTLNAQVRNAEGLRTSAWSYSPVKLAVIVMGDA
jgi:hypothetical protein